MNLSTGAANAFWNGGLCPVTPSGPPYAGLTYGVLDLFSGPMPTDPNNADSGTLLARITVASGAWVAGTSTNGLEFSTPAGGIVGIKSGQVWSGLGVAEGTIGYARFRGNVLDNGGSSTTLVRVDLTVSAGGGAEVNVSTLNVKVGVPVPISAVTLTMPRSS